MCRSPVMLGGGIEMVKALPVRGFSDGLKYPRDSQV